MNCDVAEINGRRTYKTGSKIVCTLTLLLGIGETTTLLKMIGKNSKKH